MKKSVALLICILIIGGSYAALGYTGVIQSPFSKAPTYTDAHEIDITFLSSYVNDDTFSRIMDNADSLDVHIYGVNIGSAESVITWYELENNKNGWEPFDQQRFWTRQSLLGGDLYTRVWSRYLKGQVVITVDGSYVQQYTGYQTVVITSSAPLSTYQEYIS